VARAVLNGGRHRLVSGVRAARDRLLLPEARSGRDQWQRVVLNRSVDEHLTGLGPRGLRAAEISGSGHADRPWASYASLNFPEFDICAPLEEPERFDVVICEQVLEHVLDPCAAARNLRGLCVEGGHVVVSTPFLVRVHELPAYGMPDLWRFTPRGLRVLLERAGLVVDSVQSWGNRSCVTGNFDRWPSYRRWQSLRSEPDLLVQVWAFARNPAVGEGHPEPSP
jgi:SAM-dependent methyltransferase